jgi:hypothetical protein
MRELHMSPVVHIGDKAEEELPWREDFSIWVVTTQTLDLRLSQTHWPLPLPHIIISENHICHL